MWRVATSAPQLGSWFSWASYIRELEPGTPLRPGKQLLLGYQLPIVGDYVFTATVTEVQEGRCVHDKTRHWDNEKYPRRVVLEGDTPLQPVLTAEFSSSQQGRSQLSLSVSFHRRSSLFQLQLGLLLRLVAGQQLSQSLLVLQLLIHNNVM